MTHQYPAPAAQEHDTTALPFPPVAAQSDAPVGGPASGYGYSGAYAQASAEAAHWEGRFRRERTRKRILAVTTVLAGMLAIGLGVTAWGLAQTNPLVSTASGLADRLGGSSGGSQPDASSPDANSPDAISPDATAPDPTSPSQSPTSPDGSAGDGTAPDLQLPEALRDLGSALGITDVNQLIDMAVSGGLLTQEQADQLRALLSAGAGAAGSSTTS